MWYTIPTNEEEQKRALKAFYPENKHGERESVADLLSAYTTLDNQQINGLKDELYEKLYKAYQDAGMAEGKTKDELFPSETRFPGNFRKAFESLWHMLSYQELYQTIEVAPLDADIEALLKVSDALEAKGMVQHSDMQTIFSDLLDLKDQYGDEYFAHRNKWPYNPVGVVEYILGNGAHAKGITEALSKGEIHAADYLQSRIKLLQMASENFVDSFAPLFSLYDPRTMDKQKDPSAGEIQTYLADLKAAKESLSAAQNAFSTKNVFARKVVENAEAQLAELEDFRKYEDSVHFEDCADAERSAFVKLAGAVQDNETLALNIELDNEFITYNILRDKNENSLRSLEYLVDEGLTPESEQAAEKLNAYREQFAALDVQLPAFKRFDEDVLKAYMAAEDKLVNTIVENNRDTFPYRFALEEAKNNIQEIQLSQETLKKKMKAADQQTPELLKEATKQQEALTIALQEQMQKRDEAQSGLDKVMPSCRKNLEDARNALKEIKNNGLDNLFPEAYKEQLEKEIRRKKQQNAPALQENLDKIRETCSDLRMAYRREGNLRELTDTFRAVSNSTERHWYGIVKKTPKVYADLKEAMENYLQNKNTENAERVYAECRNYLIKYMKADGKGLKHGSNLKNARHQSVVRMLEIMEDLKEFQPFLEREEPERVIEDAKQKAPEGWEVVKEKEDSRRYNKLNFSDLEKSLAKHSSKLKGNQNNVEDAQKAKAFSDLNKRIEKKAKQNRAK